jgi:hypothetical protein
MNGPTLYDDDIVLWSERQAEVLRGLESRRDLPNGLDLPNVAEEIESVGRSAIAAVRSLLARFYEHLAKCMAEPEAQPDRAWRREMLAFRGDLDRNFSESMRQRIDPVREWRGAVDDARQAAPPELRAAYLALPAEPPIGLDDILAANFELDDAIERARAHIP